MTSFKKILLYISLIASSILLSATIANAVSIFTVPQGGTGVGTITGIIKGNGTAAFSVATPGTDYLSPALSATHIFVGNASNIATDVALTLSGTGGTFGLSNAGVLTMPNADASTRGLLTAANFVTFNNKFSLPSLTNGSVVFSDGTTLAQDNTNFFWDNVNKRLGLNTNTPVTTLEVMEDSVNAVRGILSGQYSTGTNSSRFILRKARGTRASPTTVVTGDNLGAIIAEGYDGTNYLQDASIIMGTEGTIASTRVPTNIRLSTATNASPSVVTEAVRINSSQNTGFGTTTPLTRVTIGGALSYATGGGAITQIQGPSDQPFLISATSPIQTTTAQAGNALTLSSSQGVNGSVSGTGAGSNLTIKAGDAGGGLANSAAAGTLAITGSNSSNNQVGGPINITAGTSFGNQAGGLVTIRGGTAGGNGFSAIGGGITVNTGEGNTVSSSGGASGPLVLSTANTNTIVSGPLTIKTGAGSTQSYGGASGDFALSTGNAGTSNGSSGFFVTQNSGAMSLTIGTGGTNTNAAVSGTGTPGGNAGAFTIVGGAGGAITGLNTLVGGNGSPITLTSGAGGNASGGSSNTGGNSGNILLQTSAAGAGSAASGTVGTFGVNIGGANSRLFVNTQNIGMSSATPGATIPNGWIASSANTLLQIDEKDGSHNAGISFRRQDAGAQNIGLDIWSSLGDGTSFIDNRYTDAAGNITIRTQTSTTPINVVNILGNGKVGFKGVTAPTALVHLPAGTTTSTTAPLKFTSGSNMTTAEAGAKEYNGSFSSTKNSGLRYTEGGVIFNQFLNVGNVTTTETDLYTDTLPASTLAVDGESLEAVFAATTLGSATATTEMRIYFGGNVIYDSGALGLSTASDFNYNVDCIRVSSSIVRCSVAASTTTASAAPYTVYTEITGLTLSNTQVFKITGQRAGVGAASGDINGRFAKIKWFGAAGL